MKKTKEQPETLQEFLRNEAGSLLENDFFTPIVSYVEDVNDDALSDDWLANGTSYIWKVGVLSVADGNKRDWAYLFIGHHRDQHHGFEFIGRLNWADGENDDPARCLRRYLECAASADILFDEQY
jgi:hypothetical protein